MDQPTAAATAIWREQPLDRAVVEHAARIKRLFESSDFAKLFPERAAALFAACKQLD